MPIKVYKGKIKRVEVKSVRFVGDEKPAIEGGYSLPYVIRPGHTVRGTDTVIVSENGEKAKAVEPTTVRVLDRIKAAYSAFTAPKKTGGINSRRADQINQKISDYNNSVDRFNQIEGKEYHTVQETEMNPLQVPESDLEKLTK